ncbi:hypothetical protein LA080_016200 [Diaporthe eres]|nr:hypothetical protein LA080_016200 [Diaporthe eres]
MDLLYKVLILIWAMNLHQDLASDQSSNGHLEEFRISADCGEGTWNGEGCIAVGTTGLTRTFGALLQLGIEAK